MPGSGLRWSRGGTRPWRNRRHLGAGFVLRPVRVGALADPQGRHPRSCTKNGPTGRYALGKSLNLTASDGHRPGAYRADPSGSPSGGVVVIQEIFGVNHHIRAVCDRLAGEGYAAVAPALFDRQVRDFESGYTPEE